MKLKKIASLMLAGIMAVSMLAACGEGTGNNNGGASSSEQTGTSNAATVLQANLSGDARRIVKTAAANSNLDAALKNAVDTYFNYSDLCYSIAFDDVLFLKNDLKCDTNNKINKAVVDAMSAKDSVELLVNTSDKTTVAVEVYAVNASVSDTEALEMLAAKISPYLESRPEKSDDVDGSNYDYSYTISASIETREFDTVGTVKYGVKYIAVAVTQNVTRV